MTDTTRALPPREVAALLSGAAAAIRAELEALPADALAWHPATGEWCAKEVLGHLIEAERRGFAGRIRTLLAETGPRFVTWDQDAVARERGDCARETRDLLAEFLAMRTESARLVEGLAERDLARDGHHPTVGRLTVGDVLYEWIHHDRNHLRQILENVRGFVWPYMGNAQRFSRP